MRLWRLPILMEMISDAVMGVVDIGVGKVADEVTDKVVDRTNFTDVALASEDTYHYLSRTLVM